MTLSTIRTTVIAISGRISRFFLRMQVPSTRLNANNSRENNTGLSVFGSRPSRLKLLRINNTPCTFPQPYGLGISSPEEGSAAEFRASSSEEMHAGQSTPSAMLLELPHLGQKAIVGVCLRVYTTETEQEVESEG